jgi:hypothetical protein
MLYLSKEQMEKMNTRRLLNYKRKYLSHNPYMCCSVCSGTCFEAVARNVEEIAEWEIAYKNIKEILNTREHIDE